MGSKHTSGDDIVASWTFGPITDGIFRPAHHGIIARHYALSMYLLQGGGRGDAGRGGRQREKRVVAHQAPGMIYSARGSLGVWGHREVLEVEKKVWRSPARRAENVGDGEGKWRSWMHSRRGSTGKSRSHALLAYIMRRVLQCKPATLLGGAQCELSAVPPPAPVLVVFGPLGMPLSLRTLRGFFTALGTPEVVAVAEACMCGFFAAVPVPWGVGGVGKGFARTGGWGSAFFLVIVALSAIFALVLLVFAIVPLILTLFPIVFVVVGVMA
ncbi:hypothetical protein B0H10DRAFT_1942222 [Mycena sp. CBHHK59/15]|nr:hypothetical protein B0H10DRAFT_1942222 [Mycena sp. CBHHK59/15]